MKEVILVVEDEFEIRKDIIKFLEFNDFQPIGAESGIEALNILEKVTPNLIISDIMMPGIDGYQLLKKLQSNPELSSIPFLFLTARFDKKDFREGMNLGADDFITKPFDFSELLDAINVRLKKKIHVEKNFNKQLDDLRTSIRYFLPHEIRNPLNIILGFTDILRSNYDNTKAEDAKEMLANINSSCLRLNRIFENYLLLANLAVLETNIEELHRKQSERTPSAEILLTDAANVISRRYDRESDLELKLIDAVLCISEEYFVKIVTELCDNCFKFSKHTDRVIISSNSNKRMFNITFVDYGRGMSKEQISKMAAYVQFERRVYEQQGLGLGVELAKKIVDIHRGIFTIESEVNKFTKVTVSLPLAK